MAAYAGATVLWLVNFPLPHRHWAQVVEVIPSPQLQAAVDAAMAPCITPEQRDAAVSNQLEMHGEGDTLGVSERGRSL